MLKIAVEEIFVCAELLPYIRNFDDPEDNKEIVLTIGDANTLDDGNTYDRDTLLKDVIENYIEGAIRDVNIVYGNEKAPRKTREEAIDELMPMKKLLEDMLELVKQNIQELTDDN